MSVPTSHALTAGFQSFPRGDNTAYLCAGFYVGRLEDDFPQVPERGRWHRHEHFELFWITTGGGTHLSDSQSFALQTGTLVFVPPGRAHTWQQQDRIRGWIVCFDGQFLPAQVADENAWLRELPFFPPALEASSHVLVAPEAHGVLFSDWMRRLEDEYFQDRPDRRDALRALLRLLLITARRAYMAACHGSDVPPVNAADRQLTSQFLRELDSHFLTERTVDAYAARLCVSAKRLTKAVVAQTGRGPAALIRARLVLEAKRLLLHSDLSASEIAYRLDFRDLSHFGRMFGRMEGCPPAEFRRRHR